MHLSPRSFLSVDKSIGGRRWLSALDERAEASALKIAQTHGIPDVVARVLAGRGITHEEATGFLSPRIRDLMPDPSDLTDMEAAAARLADAVERQEKVAIFGDYDVDGAASAALLWRYLKHMGIDAPIRIPDRITEGYGPNPDAMRELVHDGARLIVTVDCGTGSFEAIDAARQAGADVLVLDHHQTGADLPVAVAVVNPNRQDDLSGLGHLAAAGVVFMTLVALSRELRRRGRSASELPDVFSLLDLVALATVCDVVPLRGLNRAFVMQGLKVMHAQANRGIAALSRVARLSGRLEAHHLGFLIGPRINAGGRIGDAALGSQLLCLADGAAADELAAQLDALNAERQVMERAMLEEAQGEVLAEIGSGEGPAVLVAGSARWHPGIVGLLAARLKERHRRPAFAVAFDANGQGTGSGRSIAGFDLGRLVREAVEAGILVKGGGHAMAAGITIQRAALGDFRAFLESRAAEAVRTLRATDDLAIDSVISAGGLTVELYELVMKAGPYGSGHAAPVFALGRHRIGASSVVGNGHVRATLTAADGRSSSAIAFRSADTELGARLLRDRDRPIHAAGTLSLDRFNGRQQVSFRLTDIAEAPL